MDENLQIPNLVLQACNVLIRQNRSQIVFALYCISSTVRSIKTISAMECWILKNSVMIIQQPCGTKP